MLAVLVAVLPHGLLNGVHRQAGVRVEFAPSPVAGALAGCVVFEVEQHVGLNLANATLLEHSGEALADVGEHVVQIVERVKVFDAEGEGTSAANVALRERDRQASDPLADPLGGEAPGDGTFGDSVVVDDGVALAGDGGGELDERVHLANARFVLGEDGRELVRVRGGGTGDGPKVAGQGVDLHTDDELPRDLRRRGAGLALRVGVAGAFGLRGHLRSPVIR